MSLFCIALRFADPSLASAHLPGHRAWIDRGMDDGTVLLVGSLQPNLGGVLLATADDRSAVDAFVAQDPFVQYGVVSAEMLEISPARADPRLAFLTEP